MTAFDPSMILNQIDIVPYSVFAAKYPEFVDRTRWQLFAQKGTTCVSCGIVGTHAIVWHEMKNTSQIHTDLIYLPDDYLENPEAMYRMIMITMDHILPKSKGGPKSLDNLQPMCVTCNKIKGDNVISVENQAIQIAALKRQSYLSKRLNQLNSEIKRQELDHHISTMKNALPCSTFCYLCSS